MPIKVIIADDHKIFREGLKSLLEKEKDIFVVGEAESGDDVLNLIKSVEADVILMDIDMGKPDGIETTEKIKSEYPDINILILSMMGLHDFIIQALEKGARGYILKNAGKDELLTAIKCVARGDSYFSREVSSSLIEHLNKPVVKGIKTDIPLSTRELEVLKLIAQEYSNAEIAEKLFISIRTVDTHKRNLLEKLRMKNTAGLVKYAIKNRLVE
ncbi:MAG: response regulator transcription factor [Bacteroidales bacterium]|nr:response regulator transcription factor [Bacteroidales bacterium]